jgi:hypothetical protein
MTATMNNRLPKDWREFGREAKLADAREAKRRADLAKLPKIVVSVKPAQPPKKP